MCDRCSHLTSKSIVQNLGFMDNLNVGFIKRERENELNFAGCIKTYRQESLRTLCWWRFDNYLVFMV